MKEYNFNEFVKEILDKVDDLEVNQCFNIHVADTEEYFKECPMIFGIQKIEVLEQELICAGYYGLEVHTFSNDIDIQYVTTGKTMKESLKDLIKEIFNDYKYISIQEIEYV